jgi:ribonucleoside-diphosphate reductase alpha chain
MDIFSQRMTQDVWRNKYRWQDEQTPYDSLNRVANAIFANDHVKYRDQAFVAMKNGLWLPGGRIIAGAGTEKRVTLMNCYVNETIEDSMEGIMRGNTNTALTLQQGGGMGSDFSTLRPEGALLTRTRTKASGPIPFMHMWDSMSRTIRSAGDRRGAMMGTISDTHPDLPKFIEAKQTPNALTQFNVSILVSDALMESVREDEDWMLYFPVIPMAERPQHLYELDFDDEQGTRQYVYQVWRARELWELITRATYEYSEPGVIFIDRVNDLNNLKYCETIRCTNPCGEQPLPPNGTCNLGHVNLARVVSNPHTSHARIDYGLIGDVVRIGVRFLDNVIEATQYPLEAQQNEEYAKRRLGLGFTGLADMLGQLGIRYGSHEAVRITEDVCQHICHVAYTTSYDLAAERGSFPLMDPRILSDGTFASTLPDAIKQGIKDHGLRNALILTVAPTGTGSVLYGNVSSGGEPVFLHQTQRRVLRPSDGFKDEWDTYVEWGYGARLYFQERGIDITKATPADLPSHMVTAEELSVEDHVVMQAAAQRYIDASMSKTVNIPKDMAYEQFVKVYELAYALGCKGCTTYRPSDVRGAVLSKPGEDDQRTVSASPTPVPQRPAILSGYTYKIKWPSLDAALYLTINHNEEGRPFECFINSKDSRYHDWVTSLTTMISAIWRAGMEASFVSQELMQIQSLNDSAFLEQKNHPSLTAYIGFKIQRHIETHPFGDIKVVQRSAEEMSADRVSIDTTKTIGGKCPQCAQMTLVKKEGCKTCETCGFSTCS